MSTTSESAGVKRAAPEGKTYVPTILSYSDVDVDKLTVKRRGAGPAPIIAVSFGAERLAVNITAEKEVWLRAPFGVDREDKFQNASKGDFTSFPMHLDLTPELEAFFNKIDAKAQEELNKVMPGKTWKSTTWGKEGFAKRFSPKVVAQASAGGMTQIQVKCDGATEKGEGKDCLDAVLKKHDSFRGAETKVLISPQSIWVKEDKAGINWKIVQMAVKPYPRATALWPDVFGDVFDEEDA